jgi:myosin heavy subunit
MQSYVQDDASDGGMSMAPGALMSNEKPHVYQVASAAFYGMLQHGQPQTVLVSGESGSGKTENTKFVLRFLTQRDLCRGSAVTSASGVDKKVLESNPLLEAFGNAKTVRNNNSSRFGKFIELGFRRKDARNCGLVGARVRTYLLEKIRVTEL